MRIEEMLRRKTELGYSYKQIAELSGVPLGTVQKVFGGYTKSPRYDTLQALERALCSSAGSPESAPADLSAAAQISPGAEGAAHAPRSGAGTYSVPAPSSLLCEPAPAYQTGSPGIHDMRKEQSGNTTDSVVSRKGTLSPSSGNAETDESKERSLRNGWIDPARQGTYTIADRDLLPEDLRTELIDGVLYLMASPRIIHQAISAKLTSVLINMIGSRGGSCMAFSAPMDVVLDEDDRTVVQPDVLIVCNRDRLQGRWVFGAPDFVVEIISPSSRSRDYFLKAHKYGNAGVREYWIIDPKKQKVIVYLFSHGTSGQPCAAGAEAPVSDPCKAKKTASANRTGSAAKEQAGTLAGKPAGADTASDYDCEIALYSFDAKIPVGIFGEGAFVDFAEVYNYIKGLD